MPSVGASTPCVTGNLKTWISVLIVVQLCLVLLYLDVTQRDKGSSKPLRLQSRFTLDHSLYATRASYVTNNPDEPHVTDVITKSLASRRRDTDKNSDDGAYVVNGSDGKAHTDRNDYKKRRGDQRSRDKGERLRHHKKKGNKETGNGWVDRHGGRQRSNMTSALWRSRQRERQRDGAEGDGAHGMRVNKKGVPHQPPRQVPASLQTRDRYHSHQAGAQALPDNGSGPRDSAIEGTDVKFQPVEISINHQQSQPLASVRPQWSSKVQSSLSFPGHLKDVDTSLMQPTTVSQFVNRMRNSIKSTAPSPGHGSENTSNRNKINSPQYLTSPSIASQDNIALHLDLSKPYVFHLPEAESTDKYFQTAASEDKVTPDGADAYTESRTKRGRRQNTHQEKCFIEGTAFKSSPNTYGCLCDSGYHGKHCSIPDLVYYSSGSRFMDLLTVRNTSRRIINAIAFNVEFELLEARLYELNEVVDVFIVLESNFSNFGEPKPMRLYERLKSGYLKEFHHKLFYLFLGDFPSEGKTDGWIVDQNMRHFIGSEGLRRVVNKKPDDIFIYTDADELPSRDALLFLKLHDGYPEPFGFTLRWSVFGFFWKQMEPTRVYAGCTIAMMRYVFSYDAYQLRSGDYYSRQQGLIAAYKQTGGNVFEWHLGEVGVNAGWHCSWCLPPDRIKIKLQSAINADFPRWGDFPEKLRVEYLRNLIKTGTWFDDTTRFGELVDWNSDSYYAPKYMLDNFDKYKKLLNLDDAIQV